MSLQHTLSVGMLFTLGWTGSAAAQSQPPSEPPAEWGVTAIDFSNVPYPYPVDYLDVEVYGRNLRMAFMDVAPTGTPNGQTVVFFHGFNFAGYAFAETMEILRNQGFRTIAIDRIGFGRSSKPIMHYNFHQGRFGTEAYAVEELIAELGSAFLCAHLKVTPEPRLDHAQYINNWLKVLKNDKKAIFTASARAQEAVKFLFDVSIHGTIAV